MMKTPVILTVLLALGAAVHAAPAAAQSRADQESARQEMKAGRTLPLREIERVILPQMSGRDYLGSEYDRVASAYRLKFIREGRVIWVDVDARTARVLRVSQ